MHDNPQAAPDATEARTFAGDHVLRDHTIIELSGRDAITFAQAQTMNDVAALADGQWQWNGWLTPKGRVVALFALLRLSDERVWLIVVDADADALAESLRRYVFRSKVRIEVRADLQVTGAFVPPALAQGGRSATPEPDEIELDMGADGGARRLRIGARHDPGHVDAAPADEFALHWAAFDIAHGWPRLAAGQFDAWTPQQLSLDRLQAYSVKKGCYPGQEIVARTHFLGKAKRGLALIAGAQGMSAGMSVHAAGRDGALGTLVSAVHVSAGDSLALAVVPLQRDATGLGVDGMPAREVALREGLAR